MFPGPAALGRGVVVEPGGVVPPAATEWPRLLIGPENLGEAALAELADQLDRAWRQRTPTVVELGVPLGELKQPESAAVPPYTLEPDFAFARERVHFLVWANRYDGRTGELRWHHAHRALRLGANRVTDDGEAGDVELPDGRLAWVDGGPRTRGLSDDVVVHMHQLDAGALTPDEDVEPSDDLAPDQLAAVAHPGGSARVLAPAGSGKTRVLTARLRHLLHDRGWSPATVTAVAYNTRAAGEMRSRTIDLRGAQIRTLHALGFEIIGRSRGGRPRVLNERDVRDLLDQLLAVRPRANEDVFAPYLEALGQVRSGLRTPEVVEDERDDVPGFADAFDSYRARLDQMGAIDFDEQIYGAVEVLLRDPDTRRWAQQGCRHLLVDEFQDLTPAQLLMLRLLAAPGYDVFGVGDDDQVIYGYAGADPRFLIDYDQFFPGAARFQLEVNYRCPPPVVEAASHLLSYNRRRVPKTVRAAGAEAAGVAEDNGPTGQPGHGGLEVEQVDEARLGGRLVNLVEAMLSAGASPDEVAILTRVNAGLLAPQLLLGEAGIPVRNAVDERMLDRTGMKAALAWLRLALAAGQRNMLDGRDLGVVVRRPSRSLSPGIVKALGRGQWSLSRLSGWAEDMDDARLRNGLAGLHADLERLSTLVRSGVSTADLLVDIRDAVGLGRALGRLDQAKAASASTHTDDLDALVLVARAHPDPADFEPWLVARLRTARDNHGGRPTGSTDPGPGAGDRPGGRSANPADPSVGQDPPDGDLPRPTGVTLSTVHRVKGLEWPHVVVWDASDGAMPHRLSLTAVDREEERRVFHVALTRGRRSITVLARSANPSPFLAELDGTAPHVRVEDLRPPSDRVVTSTGKTRGRRDRSDANGDGDAAPLDGEAARRSEALREWRRERAKKDGVPAYVVLHDRHLDGVARAGPDDLDALALCDGIGPTKLDRYGDDILAVLADLPAGS